MSAQKLSSHLRREQIAQAAMELIANRGLRDFNLADVARRIGVVPSALYRHFRSKDKVLDAVLDILRSRLLGNVTTARGETDDPLLALERLLMLHVQLIRESQAIPRVIFSDDLYAGHPERRQKVLGIINDYRDEIVRLVREAQEHGSVRREIEPQVVSLMFLGLLQPAAVLWFLTDGRFDVTQQVGRAWAILRTALAAPEQGGAAPRPRSRRSTRGARQGGM